MNNFTNEKRSEYRFLRQIITLFCLLILTWTVAAQISQGGSPYSFNRTTGDEIDTVIMSPVDVDALLVEDEIERELGLPFRFGAPFEVNLTLENSGTWEALPDGGMLWRLRIECPEAYSINLVFDGFHMPEGASFFLYNQDHSTVLGAFTSRNNKSHGKFATGPTKSGMCTLEYYEPPDVSEIGQISIQRIVHGYKDVFFNKGDKGFGDSGSCNNNVMCPEGDPWTDEIRSAGMLLTAGGFRFCSGALVNNVQQDQTPYFLTANHCYSSDVNTWVVMFNYQSPTCTNQDGPTTDTVSGATLRARNSTSDFCLIELSATPPSSYNVHYAGWSNLNVASQSSTAIHHPSGDIKKISFDEHPVTSTQYLSNTVNDSYSHWRIGQWEDGTTEGGSSGSPLFDQNHRIVGQLHGGYASCTSITSDWYGKFSTSWATGASQSSRLKEWLDPDDTGVETLNGFDPHQNDPPEVHIIQPEPDTVVFDIAPVEATATDDHGITKVEFFVNDESIGVITIAPYQLQWNSKDFDDGDYTLKAVATDTGGLTDEDSIPVTVENEALQCSASASQESNIAPSTVFFQSQISGGTPPYTIDWDFGDDSEHSSQEDPVHIYTLSKTYTWTLTVHDDVGDVTTATGDILVGLPPVGSPGIYYAVHMTGITGWTSQIPLVNRGNVDNPVFFYTLDALGTHIHTFVVDSLPPQAKIEVNATELLPGDKLDEDVWVIVASESDLAGMSMFGTTDLQTQVALPLFQNAAAEMIFPYVVISDTYFTGITLVNTDETEASVTLSAYLEGGDLLTSVETTIPSLGKYVRLLNDIFDTDTPGLIRSVVVQSDRLLVGFELFGSYVDEGLAGLPTFPFPSGTVVKTETTGSNGAKEEKDSPSKPTGLRGWGLSSSDIYLTWNQNPEPDVSYIIYRKDGIFTAEVATTSDTSFTITGLDSENSYFYFVRAKFNSTSQLSPSSTYIYPSTLSPGEEDYPYRLFCNELPNPENYFTGVTFSNLDAENANIHARLYDAQGELLAQADWQPGPLEQVTREIWWLFDGSVIPDAAYLKLGSDKSFIGFELFLTPFDSTDPFQFDGIPGVFWGGNTHCYPVVMTGEDWSSSIRITNTSPLSADITVIAYDGDGSELGSFPMGLSGRGQFQQDPADMFPGVADDIAWLSVNSNKPVTSSMFCVSTDLTRLLSYVGIEVE